MLLSPPMPEEDEGPVVVVVVPPATTELPVMMMIEAIMLPNDVRRNRFILIVCVCVCAWGWDCKEKKKKDLVAWLVWPTVVCGEVTTDLRTFLTGIRLPLFVG